MQACLTISARVSWCIRLGIVRIAGSYVKQGYVSGGAGYVLSKEALKRFVEAFKTDKCTHSSSIEDLALGRCMEIINVEAGDSRDTTGKETFHPFVPEHHLIKGYLPRTFWYWNYNYYPPVEVSLEILLLYRYFDFCLFKKKKLIM